MYLEHFKLRQFPFVLTPNTQYFCDLPTYQAALNVLLLSLINGEGFIKIVGEVGSGKTLLCRKLLNSLDDRFVAAYIPNPHFNPDNFHRTIARELGINLPETLEQADLLNLISKRIMSLRANGKFAVLIIDEAQTMPNDTLEALRLLTNLETESEKLLQIVLFAQPELDERLDKRELRQLNQRITFSYSLLPLSYDDVVAYVHHRLSVAGLADVEFFKPKALKLLAHYSTGIPRLINILSHKAMLVAYGRGKKAISSRSMMAAINDSRKIITLRFSQFKRLSVFFGIVLATVVVSFAYYSYLSFLFTFN